MYGDSKAIVFHLKSRPSSVPDIDICKYTESCSKKQNKQLSSLIIVIYFKLVLYFNIALQMRSAVQIVR